VTFLFVSAPAVAQVPTTETVGRGIIEVAASFSPSIKAKGEARCWQDGVRKSCVTTFDLVRGVEASIQARSVPGGSDLGWIGLYRSPQWPTPQYLIVRRTMLVILTGSDAPDLPPGEEIARGDWIIGTTPQMALTARRKDMPKD
jgi:hypothetical protein